MASAESHPPRVALINPLGAALSHYQLSLEQTLLDAGAHVASLKIAEPSVSGDSRARWLQKYSASLFHARTFNPEIALSLWPAVGYLDFALLRLLPTGVMRWLVIHDPEPLVDARGYGATSRAYARFVAGGARALTHTSDAAGVVRRDTGLANIAVVPHPTTRPLANKTSSNGRPIVRVLGQFKKDRDIGALEQIARDAPEDWSLEIVGRGWPSVSGWKVDDRFVPEHDFIEAMATSSVVLIPYRRFFQSGVALRCLELGVPVVGPSGTSLEEPLGRNHPWLVENDWLASISHAIENRKQARALHRSYHKATQADWARWLADNRARRSR